MEVHDGQESLPWEEERAFADRTEAARLLAARLQHYRGRNPLVLGIPRGAVPMAKVIADALGGELDVVLLRPFVCAGAALLADAAAASRTT